MKSDPQLEYKDLSTPNSFQFSFHCSICGAGATSERYSFNFTGFGEEPAQSVRTMVWALQHKEAYERAAYEARCEFNYCPSCNRYVCDKCFCMSADGSHTAGACRDCKAQKS
ncbi:MAG: hypothetical protein FWG10_06620 [Eubacteriaceae bacterium]|nr:hypothetical protein [Eubacteriaceae bacterium]